MKKIIVVTSLIFLCSSCFVHKGEWRGDKCRPKNPNFKLLNKPKIEMDLLVFNKTYTLNGDNKHAIGFYEDGRFILIFDYNKTIQNYQLLSESFIKNSGWEDARFIGYWRIIDGNIYIEYFVCGNSGEYIRKQGEIKGDTLFFERNCGSKPFKREKCYDEYILSSMNFD